MGLRARALGLLVVAAALAISAQAGQAHSSGVPVSAKPTFVALHVQAPEHQQRAATSSRLLVRTRYERVLAREKARHLAARRASLHAAAVASSAPPATPASTPTVAPVGSVQSMICRVFGDQCSMALAVAYRESRYETTAVNGQFLGIFQMGSNERSEFATLGYSTAYAQIVAAHNYYEYEVAHGTWGWRPWSETAY